MKKILLNLFFIQLIAAVGMNVLSTQAADTYSQIWSKGGRAPDNYQTGSEYSLRPPNMFRFIQSATLEQNNTINGTYTTRLNLSNFPGKKILFSASVKSTDSNKKERSAYFFVQVPGQIEKYKWINDEHEWHKVSLILDLPETTTSILYGLSLWGSGKVSLADISIQNLDSGSALH